MPTLDRITVYPVKSLDGVEVERTRVLPGGALEHDRRWQLLDPEGRVVNAKRTPLVHAIRADFRIAGTEVAGGPPGVAVGSGPPAPGRNMIALWVDPAAIAAGAIPGVGRLAGLGPAAFPLVPGGDGPCGWLAEALGCEVLLLERAAGGFPDDRDAAGPTLVATATLAEVARWFTFDLAEARRRFRVNLELGGCDAFWEDTLASPARPDVPAASDLPPGLPADPYAGLPPPDPRAFSIGAVRFRAVNVCRRCVVPTRDSVTGAPTAHFRDAFEARRARALRADVDVSAWSHLYRLAVNTCGADPGIVARGERVVVR